MQVIVYAATPVGASGVIVELSGALTSGSATTGAAATADS